MRKLNPFVVALALLAGAGAAQADTYSFSGSLTATDATFNRPFTLTSLSGSGTAVHYDVAAVFGVTPGAYDFRMLSTAGAFDTFLALYAGSFNPASPLTNLVALNDDFVAGNTASGSGFSFTLAGNTMYYVVSTAFSNSGLGGYTTTVTSAVPEASTYAMMALGLAVFGVGRLRRR